MSRGEQMLAQMTTPCPRCGLRGPHECLPARFDPFARPGLGPVFPAGAGGTWSAREAVFKHRDGLETCKAAAIRLGVDQHRLGEALARSGLKREGAYWKLHPREYDRIVERVGRSVLAAKLQRTGRACPSP